MTGTKLKKIDNPGAGTTGTIVHTPAM